MEENNNELNKEPIKDLKQEKVREESINSETKFKPVGELKQKPAKKKKGKAKIFILLLLTAIIGGLAYYYFEIYTNPQKVYQQIIKTGLNSLINAPEEMKTIKANTKLDMDIALKEEFTQSQKIKTAIDIANKLDVNAEIQMDFLEKKALFKLDSDYEDEELLNGDILLDIKNKGTYAKLEQFFEDILEIEIEEEYYNELNKILETEKLTKEQQKNISKVVKILNNEIVKSLKEEYFTREMAKITINSKEVNAGKYTLKMTCEEVINELKTVIENLKNNEEFLNCFDIKDELQERLQTILEKIKYTMIPEGSISVQLYRIGLKQEFARIDFEIENRDEKHIFKVEKVDNGYNFELSFENVIYFTATVTEEKIDETTSKFNFKLESPQIGTVTFNVEYGYILNEEIETIEIENAVKVDELSQADTYKAMANYLESKLYEVVQKFTTIEEEPEINIEIPDNTGDKTREEIEKKISSKGVKTPQNAFIVFAQNSNDIAVDMEIEVEFYDADGKFLGSSSDELMGVGAGREIALEMINVPDDFATYQIYVEASETVLVKEYFKETEISQHNNNGKNIVVQVKNNSQYEIENMSICVLYYNKGEIVGISNETVCGVREGRTGNFNLEFPYDSESNNIEFDDYKVILTGAYSYVY